MTTLLPATAAYNTNLANYRAMAMPNTAFRNTYTTSPSTSPYASPRGVVMAYNPPATPVMNSAQFSPVTVPANSQRYAPAPSSNEGKSWMKNVAAGTLLYLLGATLAHKALGGANAFRKADTMTHVVAAATVGAGLKLATNTRQQLGGKDDTVATPGWLSSFVAMAGTAAGIAYLFRRFDVSRLLSDVQVFNTLKDQPFFSRLMDSVTKLSAKQSELAPKKPALNVDAVQPTRFKKNA